MEIEDTLVVEQVSPAVGTEVEKRYKPRFINISVKLIHLKFLSICLFMLVLGGV